MSRSRLQVIWALGQSSWTEARAYGLAGLGPCLVQGVRVMDRTIGSGPKAQRAWGPRTIKKKKIYIYIYK